MAAVAALSLTACGSDDREPGKPAGRAEGTEDSKKAPESPKAAETPASPVKGVDLGLPKEMKLAFDFPLTGDKGKDAALRDAEDFVRSIYKGVAEQSADDPAHHMYAREDGLLYARDQIARRVDKGQTATGLRRHYRAETKESSNGTGFEVSFCLDESAFFTKDAKTGKVFKLKPSIEDYSRYRVVMTEVPKLPGAFQASKVDVEQGVASCKG
ncbi:hypothetical protein G5C51_35240 [Streptomyces sp. A7024]|uniref:Uncharacterized protein n=1 Tax=Streptomyces coryli TaxID=1128680 RepID=A0A6G4UBN8_9ACTN|nr:hypothetical protein [Streptomyces coryli]NGN69130.1 hypothetical protein [Streptomyces coryli]